MFESDHFSLLTINYSSIVKLRKILLIEIKAAGESGAYFSSNI